MIKLNISKNFEDIKTDFSNFIQIIPNFVNKFILDTKFEYR